MKLVAFEPLPAGIAAALERLERSHAVTVERIPLEGAADPQRLALAATVVLLDAARFGEARDALRGHADLGALQTAVWGDAAAGRAALDTGADLFVDPAEDPALLASRLLALSRRAPRLDSLTGLGGSRLFHEALRREFDRASRYKRALGLVAVAPDSPALPDAALRALAQRLRGLVRDVDLIARLPGNRFGLLLPETDARGAVSAAERVRAAIAAPPASAEGDGLPSSPVSIGVAAIPSRGMERPDDLLGRAFEALLQAQRRGGNQVISFGAAEIIWSRHAPDPAQL